MFSHIKWKRSTSCLFNQKWSGGPISLQADPSWVPTFNEHETKDIFPKQRLRGGVLTFKVGKWAAVLGFFGAGGLGCGCGWGFLVPVVWLWLGCPGAGAVPMAGAGSCGCIFWAFSCGCRADGSGILCMPAWCFTWLFACSFAWLLVYAHAPNDDAP